MNFDFIEGLTEDQIEEYYDSIHNDFLATQVYTCASTTCSNGNSRYICHTLEPSNSSYNCSYWLARTENTTGNGSCLYTDNAVYCILYMGCRNTSGYIRFDYCT